MLPRGAASRSRRALQPALRQRHRRLLLAFAAAVALLTAATSPGPWWSKFLTTCIEWADGWSLRNWQGVSLQGDGAREGLWTEQAMLESESTRERALFESRRALLCDAAAAERAGLSALPAATDCVCSGLRPCFEDIGVKFFIAGFPKSGTTQLVALLNEHEGTSVHPLMATTEHLDLSLYGRVGPSRGLIPNDNESYFFRPSMAAGRDPIEFISARKREVHDTVARGAHQQLPVVGIKDPDMAYDAGAVLHAASVPRSKVILAVRDPLDWIVSFYNYRLEEYEYIRPEWLRGPDGDLRYPVSCPSGVQHSGEYPPTFRDIAAGCCWVGVCRHTGAQIRHIIEQNVLTALPRERVLLIDMDSRFRHDSSMVYEVLSNFLQIGTIEFKHHTHRVRHNAAMDGHEDRIVDICAEEHREERKALWCFFSEKESPTDIAFYNSLSRGLIDHLNDPRPCDETIHCEERAR